MRRATLLIQLIVLASGYLTNAPVASSQTIEHRDGFAHVHNTSEGIWAAAPRIGLSFLGMFGDEDDDNYIFYEPQGIAADGEGHIYVLDAKNHRVQVFDEERRFLHSFGRQGQGPGEFERAECIDLDDAGNIYVGDPGNGRIEVFDPSGIYLQSIRIPAINIIFRVMASGDILLRNPNLDGGRGLKDGHVPLFRVLDSMGKLKREFGEGIFFTRPPYTAGGNRSLITTDAQDNAYMAFLFQNRISKYLSDGSHVLTADRPVPDDKLINKELDMYTTINTGLDVDARGRIWVVSYTRQWQRDELIHRSWYDGQEQITGDRSKTETDMFEIQVFREDGVLLQKIPLTHFCDYLKIIGDRLYILDRDRLGQFYVYQIDESRP